MTESKQITPVSILKVDFFTNAKFPSLNKNDNFNDYLTQIMETETSKAKITEIITLNDADFETFKNSLLDDQKWLNGKGGTDSTFVISKEVKYFWEMTEADQKEWTKNCFVICVMVQDLKGNNFLVDPQGYNYARYCGVIA